MPKGEARRRTRAYDRQPHDRLRRAAAEDDPGHLLAEAARMFVSRCFSDIRLGVSEKGRVV
jgi:hypothetical protein